VIKPLLTGEHRSSPLGTFPRCRNCRPCTLTLDGNDVGTANSNAAAYGDPIILYSNNNLQLEDHVFVITVKNPSYPNTVEVDRFVVNVTNQVTYTSSYVYTGPGSTATGAAVPSGSVASNNGTTNTTTQSSTPIAAIAGAVAGVVVVVVLLIVWWRLRRNKATKNRVLTKATGYVKPAPRNSGMFNPATDAEKIPFRSNAVAPSSYVSSSPPPSTYGPSSPPASTVGYNSYPFSAAVPSVVSHTASPPGSPQPTTRPMSTASSAHTASHYTSGAPTMESGGFNAFSPQQQFSAITPVWATPASVQPITHTPVPTQPSLTPTPLPTPAPVTAAEESRPEKARYAGSAAPPEKTRFTGSSTSPSNAGASSSAAPTVNTAAAVASGSDQAGQNDVILSPTVPDAPPPAYQV
jgi:hypothetical protein